jgi:hypothetical protein
MEIVAGGQLIGINLLVQLASSPVVIGGDRGPLGFGDVINQTESPFRLSQERPARIFATMTRR